MKKLFYFILCSCSFSNSLSVEQLYGDRIELLGISFKDPLVLCQIFIALFLVIVFLQSSLDKIFDRGNNLAFFELQHHTFCTNFQMLWSPNFHSVQLLS